MKIITKYRLGLWVLLFFNIFFETHVFTSYSLYHIKIKKQYVVDNNNKTWYLDKNEMLSRR